MFLNLMYITNDPEVALIAEKNGVDRIWIDLETLGKEERQKNMNTVKSKHSISDIKRIKPLLTKSKLLVRVNPWNPDSENEINQVIEAGADMIMLPMWKTLDDVKKFLNVVNKRSKTTLLLETKEAMECVDEVLENGGFDEIHIGLNDLHLSLNLKFMFQLLADGTVEKLCNKFKKYNIPYGFGGIAKIGEGLLPAEKIILEHYRLGSTRAILSRSFCDYSKCENYDEVEKIFNANMKQLNDFNLDIKNVSDDDFKDNIESIKLIVEKIVKSKE